MLHGQAAAHESHETSTCACNTRVTSVTFDLHVRVLAKACRARTHDDRTRLSANTNTHGQGDRFKQLTKKMLQTDTSRTEIQDLSERRVARSSSGAVQHRHPYPRQNQPHRSQYQPLLCSLSECPARHGRGRQSCVLVPARGTNSNLGRVGGHVSIMSFIMWVCTRCFSVQPSVHKATRISMPNRADKQTISL